MFDVILLKDEKILVIEQDDDFKRLSITLLHGIRVHCVYIPKNRKGEFLKSDLFRINVFPMLNIVGAPKDFLKTYKRIKNE